MRIISWNANGKFREKFSFILNEAADIYVIRNVKIRKYLIQMSILNLLPIIIELVKTSIMVLEYLLKIMLN